MFWLLFLSSSFNLKFLILGDGMSGIANHAKLNQHEEFAQSVREVNDSIYGLIEASAQAAYLVSIY